VPAADRKELTESAHTVTKRGESAAAKQRQQEESAEPANLQEPTESARHKEPRESAEQKAPVHSDKTEKVESAKPESERIESEKLKEPLGLPTNTAQSDSEAAKSRELAELPSMTKPVEVVNERKALLELANNNTESAKEKEPMDAGVKQEVEGAATPSQEESAQQREPEEGGAKQEERGVAPPRQEESGALEPGKAGAQQESAKQEELMEAGAGKDARGAVPPMQADSAKQESAEAGAKQELQGAASPTQPEAANKRDPAEVAGARRERQGPAPAAEAKEPAEAGAEEAAEGAAPPRQVDERKEPTEVKKEGQGAAPPWQGDEQKEPAETNAKKEAQGVVPPRHSDERGGPAEAKVKKEAQAAPPPRQVDARKEPAEAGAKKEVQRAVPAAERRQKPEPRSELAPITLTILGTQDDPRPDRMVVAMRLDSTVGELRLKVSEKLHVGQAATAAIKFISKSANNFGTMRDSEKVKEQIYVRGIGTLQLKPMRDPAPFEEKKVRAPAPAKAPVPKVPMTEHLDLMIVVDRSANFSVLLRVRKESTIWQIKEKLVAGNPSAKANPKSFGLAPFKKDSPRLEAVNDSARINYSCTLEVVGPHIEETLQPQRQTQPQSPQPQQQRHGPSLTSSAIAPPAPEPLTVMFTRLTTLEDPRPQRFDIACETTSKISDVRRSVADVCKLDDRAAGRVKILFRVVGGNGFMTAKENELVVKEMFLHNIDRWPGD